MDRESTIHDFKTDVCNLLIATSVAARGLDIKDLIVVINYDPPNHHEDYIHRVGRTGGIKSNLYSLFQNVLYPAFSSAFSHALQASLDLSNIFVVHAHQLFLLHVARFLPEMESMRISVCLLLKS